MGGEISSAGMCPTVSSKGEGGGGTKYIWGPHGDVRKAHKDIRINSCGFGRASSRMLMRWIQMCYSPCPF